MIKKYFTNNSQKYAPLWMVFAIDTIIVALAFCLSSLIGFSLKLNFDFNQFLLQLSVILFLASVSFLLMGSFKNIIRHTGFTDIVNLFKAVSFMTILTGLFMILNKKLLIISGFKIPLSILIIYALTSFILLSSSRLMFKNYYNYLRCKHLPYKRVLIYGIGDSGVITYSTIINYFGKKFQVVGFIEDSNKGNRKNINGVPIFTKSIINEEFIKVHNINEIIVSSENIDETNSTIFNNLKVKITKVPPIKYWINGDLALNKLKEIKTEDLLGRIPIKINNTNIVKEFIDQTLLITGAASPVGKELVNKLINFNIKKLILLDQSESDLYDLQQELKQNGKHNFIAIVADISDSLRIDMLFQEYKPTVVFHAAEYKNEQLMEKSPYEAIKVNINGTKFLADTSSRYNVKKFVFVSTDKAINPTSSIGVTKRLAELYLNCLQKESKTKFIITRFGDILGTKCSVVSSFEKQIENGGPITISNKDKTSFFITIPEVVELILEAGTMGKGGEIFIFDTGHPIKIYDLAKKMINLSGLQYPKDIDIKVTGLNSGEKIHQKFISNIENPLYTYHKKVMIFNSIELNYDKIKSEIEELCFTNRFQHSDIVLKMKQLIPECQPNTSDYEHLYKRVQSYKNEKGILPKKRNQVNIN